MRGAFGILFLFIVAIVAGLIGFQAGVMSNVGATGAGVVYYGGFFPFGGFLFLLLFIGLLLFAFGGRRRRWGGYGSFGHAYGPMGEGDPRREWIADAHRRLHEQEARATTAAGSTGGTTTGTPTTPADGPSAS